MTRAALLSPFALFPFALSSFALPAALAGFLCLSAAQAQHLQAQNPKVQNPPTQNPQIQNLQIDQITRTVQAALSKCGSAPTLSDPLTDAAADALSGATFEGLLAKHGYVVYRATGWGFEVAGPGALTWLGTTLGKKCAELRGYPQFGLAAQNTAGSTRIYLIEASPAQVDLSQKRRWLDEFLAATNRARAQGQTCGGKRFGPARPLKWNAQLEAAAARHASDMVRLNFRGHVNPLDHSQPWQRARAAGFTGRGVGENLTYGPVTPQEAVQVLLTSPLHCENMLNPQWTQFGAAVENGTAKTLFGTYWAQEFGAY